MWESSAVKGLAKVETRPRSLPHSHRNTSLIITQQSPQLCIMCGLWWNSCMWPSIVLEKPDGTLPAKLPPASPPSPHPIPWLISAPCIAYCSLPIKYNIQARVSHAPAYLMSDTRKSVLTSLIQNCERGRDIWFTPSATPGGTFCCPSGPAVHHSQNHFSTIYQKIQEAFHHKIQ